MSLNRYAAAAGLAALLSATPLLQAADMQTSSPYLCYLRCQPGAGLGEILPPIPPQTNNHKGLGDIQLLTLGDAGVTTRINEYKALGVKWYRFEFDWALIQPDNADSWRNLETYDGIVKQLRAAGIELLGLIVYTPRWANGGNSNKYTPPSNNAEFAKFAAAMVARYKADIKDWEVWNEPNLGAFWSPTPNAANYTGLLRETAAAIRGADPQARIVSAGLAQPGNSSTTIEIHDFLRGMYAAGAQGNFDALGNHPYCKPPVPCDNIKKIYDPQYAPTLLDIMASNGDGGKKVWITEWGCPTGGTNSGAVCQHSHQAASVTELFTLASTASWAGPVFWYNLEDFCHPGSSQSECYFGIMNADKSHKPSWDTFVAAPQ